jgi:polyphosphate kinase 2 (PPK2 family)
MQIATRVATNRNLTNSKMKTNTKDKMRYLQFIVKPNKKFSFKDFKPGFTGDFKNEEEAEKSIERDTAGLSKYQDIMSGHEKYGLLIIFQGVDAR